jgi:hypothetical protein
MVQHRTFMDLALDDDGLHTPDGTLQLDAMTRAVVVRHFIRDAGEGHSVASPAGVVGGALLGGAIAGPAGLIGGALLGSTVKREASGADGIPRTVSASVILESPELAFSTTVGRDRVEEAEAFVRAVKDAAGLR